MSADTVPEILLVCAEKGFFGQERKPWVSMDIAMLERALAAHGLRVNSTDIASLAANAHLIQNKTIFYAFSQREHLRAYIKDVMLYLHKQNSLIPDIDLLLCHENKGYAELYRQRLGIGSPKGFYLCSADSLPENDIHYPIVLKSISGTNAKGVRLCHSRKDLLIAIRSLSPSVRFFTRLDHWRRKHLRKGRSYEGYPAFEPLADADAWLRYMTPEANFLLQEFIPGLDSDYRVIAIGHRYYVMQRLVNKGDFRASGTKRFVFITEAATALLDYADDVFRRFHTPFLSMDIGHSKGSSHLFEFQALHFGTAAIVRSQGYFHRSSGAWQFVPSRSALEESLATGLAEYLQAGKR